METLRSPWLACLTCAVFLSGCAGPGLTPIALDGQTIAYQAGHPTLVSEKTNVVALTILSAEVQTHAFLAVGVVNRSATVATIDATNVTADSGGKPLHVFTAPELEHIARVQKGWAIAATILGAAAGAAAASAPTTTYTSGSVGGTTFNASTTTYNPALAAAATSAVSANASAQLTGIEIAHQQRRGQIAGILQLTTVYPKQGAGGVVEIDKKGMNDPVNVHVRFAGEVHHFALHFSGGNASSKSHGVVAQQRKGNARPTPVTKPPLLARPSASPTVEQHEDEIQNPNVPPQ